MKFTNVSIIQDAKSIVEWYSSTMGEEARMQEDQSTRNAKVCRFFWEVVDVDRSQLYECKMIKGTRQLHSVRTSENAIFEIQTRKLSCFCTPCSTNEWEDCESAEWVDGWVRVSLPIGPRIGLELAQLEEDESAISLDYDHISDLVQPGSSKILWIILRKNNIICFIYLLDSHVVTSFFCRAYICSG